MGAYYRNLDLVSIVASGHLSCVANFRKDRISSCCLGSIWERGERMMERQKSMFSLGNTSHTGSEET